MNHALLLFAHGARDPQWAEPFVRIRDQLRERLGNQSVELAFLELMQPTLADAVAQLEAEGAMRITLVPMFLARGGHMKEDLPRLVAEVQTRHPRLQIRTATALGESAEILDALAHWVLQQYRDDG